VSSDHVKVTVVSTPAGVTIRCDLGTVADELAAALDRELAVFRASCAALGLDAVIGVFYVEPTTSASDDAAELERQQDAWLLECTRCRMDERR
jgi:hypothetical protein